jgi:hypothetical protein
MFLFPLHVDRQLARLATSGTLPPRQWGRVLRHARGCSRCGARYERVVNMQRVLAHGALTEPTAAELESVAALGLRAALAAAAPARGGLLSRRAGSASTGATRAPWGSTAERDTGAPRWWSGLGSAGALAAVAACALLLLVAPREEEWGTRGEGTGATAVLRLFCVPEDSALREVKGEGLCPPGAALAFAAAVRPPLTHAAVVVRGASGARVEGPFEVKTAPGAEAALDLTPRLPGSGVVEVTTVFAASAEAALAAARGDAVEGVVRVQHRVRVEAAP